MAKKKPESERDAAAVRQYDLLFAATSAETKSTIACCNCDRTHTLIASKVDFVLQIHTDGWRFRDINRVERGAFCPSCAKLPLAALRVLS